MTVSRGGTISWMPTVDSMYVEHDTFFVANKAGIKDTLSMNIIVNSQDIPNRISNPSISSRRSSMLHGFAITSFPSFVTFSLPIKSATFGIYDIHGRLVGKVPIVNGAGVWRGTSDPGPVSTGRYFATVLDGKGRIAQPFIFIRK
jgi:hypothetical protein